MATTNNLSTILQKNTKKLTLILLYTVLEWILIFFLLLNSIFAYSIAKFANYFKLKPPCLLCCRLHDHISDTTAKTKTKSSYTDLVCENHAAEISGLSFCVNHRKLAETESMCTDCFASNPSHIDGGFISWDIGIENVGNGETGSRVCSCCDERLTGRLYPRFSLLKTSSGCTRTGSLTVEETEEEIMKIRESKHEVESLDDSVQVITQFRKDSGYCSCDRLIPIELIDLSLEKNNLPSDSIVEKRDLEIGDDISDMITVEMKDESIDETREESPNLSKEINEVREELDQYRVDDDTKSNNLVCKEGSRHEANTHHQAQELVPPLQFLKNRSFTVENGVEIILDSTTPHVENRDVKTRYLDSNETEDDDEKSPETPRYVENLDCLRKKLLDGLVECNDEVQSIERLTTALASERKTLAALYAELEEERSASAVAANETMAMITRLQEEKAATQMEALQYQRMMDEQSEYDQEVLQLLNELMDKREKEKQELEKELNVYRNKVLDYEAKDKTSLHEDNDIDEMSLDCVKQISSLDGSLAEYEDERRSILNQLNDLEHKLLKLEDNEEFNSVDESTEQHNISNGFSVISPESKTMTCIARNLLPFLDSDDEEMLEEQHIERKEYDDVNSKKDGFVEEVDNVYERLQALEVDREFLNHCVGSITKGDKGMELLQEVLQHLRDLKSVELRVNNITSDD